MTVAGYKTKIWSGTFTINAGPTRCSDVDVIADSDVSIINAPDDETIVVLAPADVAIIETGDQVRRDRRDRPERRVPSPDRSVRRDRRGRHRPYRDQPARKDRRGRHRPYRDQPARKDRRGRERRRLTRRLWTAPRRLVRRARSRARITFTQAIRPARRSLRRPLAAIRKRRHRQRATVIHQSRRPPLSRRRSRRRVLAPARFATIRRNRLPRRSSSRGGKIFTPRRSTRSLIAGCNLTARWMSANLPVIAAKLLRHRNTFSITGSPILAVRVAIPLRKLRLRFFRVFLIICKRP